MNQLQAIIWLRWRLSRNQFIRAGKLNAIISVVLLGAMLLLSLGFAVGSVVGGVFVGPRAPAQVLLLIWDGTIFLFLIFWFSGLMVEIQRSESIDLGKLLHLPVTLQQVFVFNYVASHATPSIVLLLPAMLGFSVGLAAGARPALALLIPLVLSFVFLITSWTYCLRGWLAALMTNKRRRRTIVVWVTIFFVVIAQLPNLVFNSRFFRQNFAHRPQAHRQTGEAGQVIPEPWVHAHLALPPGWVGYSAMELKEGRWLPALGAIAANLLIGAMGLMRAYRITLRFYRGADNGEAQQPPTIASPRPRGILLVERQLPWLPEEVAALTLATIRSLLRAPELKMALIMPIVLAIVFLSMQGFQRRSAVPGQWMAFIATGVVAVASFSLAPTMSNVFGIDRNGFRALVLLPTRRHYILLAKNLAFFPFVASVSFLLLVFLKALLKLPWGTFLPGLLQVPIAFMLFCLACNLLSILTPYRLSPNTLQAKKPKPIVFLAVFISMLALPIVIFPIMIPPGLQLLFNTLDWLPWLPVNGLATLALLAGVGGLYYLVLPAQGRLLQRREMVILREVTEEVE